MVISSISISSSEAICAIPHPYRGHIALETLQNLYKFHLLDLFFYLCLLTFVTRKPKQESSKQFLIMQNGMAFEDWWKNFIFYEVSWINCITIKLFRLVSQNCSTPKPFCYIFFKEILWRQIFSPEFLWKLVVKLCWQPNLYQNIDTTQANLKQNHLEWYYNR